MYYTKPNPEEPNSEIKKPSDEMCKELSSQDRKDAIREWTLSECQERWKPLKDAETSGLGLSMKYWEKRNGQVNW